MSNLTASDEKWRPILCLDFDGVCHSYTSGWQGEAEIPDPPVDGLFEFLAGASEHFDIHIYSTRSKTEAGRKAMEEWFIKQFLRHEGGPDVLPSLYFPAEKPPALVSLDDRAITFTGKWPDPVELRKFKPWNKGGTDD